MEFYCFKCNEIITIKYLTPGEIAKCKNCGAENIVPSSDNQDGRPFTAVKRESDLRVPDDAAKQVIFNRYLPIAFWFSAYLLIAMYLGFRHDIIGLPESINPFFDTVFRRYFLEIGGSVSALLWLIINFYIYIKCFGITGFINPFIAWKYLKLNHFKPLAYAVSLIVLFEIFVIVI